MKRALVVPEIRLERAAQQPLSRQMSAQIAAAIRQGALPQGACLPSSRLLARLLNVSRNTVVEAYEELRERGLVSVRPGSGIRVSTGDRHTIPDFSSLRRTARRAHYPQRTIAFEDPDGLSLYLNVSTRT